MALFRKAGTSTEVLRAPPERLSGDPGRGTGESTLATESFQDATALPVTLSFLGTLKSQCGVHEVKVDPVALDLIGSTCSFNSWYLIPNISLACDFFCI